MRSYPHPQTSKGRSSAATTIPMAPEFVVGRRLNNLEGAMPSQKKGGDQASGVNATRCLVKKIEDIQPCSSSWGNKMGV